MAPGQLNTSSTSRIIALVVHREGLGEYNQAITFSLHRRPLMCVAMSSVSTTTWKTWFPAAT